MNKYLHYVCLVHEKEDPEKAKYLDFFDVDMSMEEIKRFLNQYGMDLIICYALEGPVGKRKLKKWYITGNVERKERIYLPSDVEWIGMEK